MIGSHPLLSYMEFLSEKYLHTGWYDGLEFFVWHHYRHGSLFEPAEHARIDQLLSLYNGWFVWPASADVPLFVEMPRWREIYVTEMPEDAE